MHVTKTLFLACARLVYTNVPLAFVFEYIYAYICVCVSLCLSVYAGAAALGGAGPQGSSTTDYLSAEEMAAMEAAKGKKLRKREKKERKLRAKTPEAEEGDTASLIEVCEQGRELAAWSNKMAGVVSTPISLCQEYRFGATDCISAQRVLKFVECGCPHAGARSRGGWWWA